MITQAPICLALDIGGTRLRIGLAQGSAFITETSENFPVLNSAEQELKAVADRILALIDDVFPSRKPMLQAVSLASGALIEAETGKVISWPNRAHWTNINLRAFFERRFKCPVLLLEDANAAALGEYFHGRGRGCRAFAYVTLSTGIGCGLVLNGKIYRGAHGWAGELGHTTVAPNGPPCICGKKGCLQAVASGRAIGETWLKQAGNGLAGSPLADAAAAAEAARLGRADALNIFREAGNYLGMGLANLTTLLDLEMIVYGGGLTLAGKVLTTPMEHRFFCELPPATKDRVRLEASDLGDRVGLLGALGAVTNHLSIQEVVS